ncbi:hypothetical protein TNIN_385901 [Trichonephila inaurata madagascariensis]|uniref:Uncharacterized protein n=1 Tax=Trichonephila inaurata madagascariensis TaxID=2747483 RepID=A0A8X6XVA0_9ARAC|nr:hypothetical protein TNIN_385901 [Trichonephila inaurata madagascariensis]
MDALLEAMGAFDNKQVEVRPSLESLQFFSYKNIVKNLKHSHSLMEEDESWDHKDILRVSQEELKQFIKFHMGKNYLERENHGWDLVIGATDLATYVYIDRIIPEVMQYLEKEHHVHDMMKRYRWREEEPANV